MHSARNVERANQSGFGRGGACSSSIAAFTRAVTASVSAIVSPSVAIGSPTRISKGWDLMWYVF
ncbi:MAG: hypothetical protein WA389_08210, partial [Terriglobales bacterium]